MCKVHVVEFLDLEHALLIVYDHPIVGEEVKDLMKVCFVLLFGWFATSISSKKTKMMGMPWRMPSISLWNAWEAFFIPKGMQSNSQSLKGVMMAILMISADVTGIWW